MSRTRIGSTSPCVAGPKGLAEGDSRGLVGRTEIGEPTLAHFGEFVDDVLQRSGPSPLEVLLDDHAEVVADVRVPGHIVVRNRLAEDQRLDARDMPYLVQDGPPGHSVASPACVIRRAHRPRSSTAPVVCAKA